MALLSVKELQVSYGNVGAVKKVSFDVEEGTMVTLLGANGAGKSTILKAIAGAIARRQGEVLFDGGDISRASAASIVKSGVSLVPEGRHVFPESSVEENLRLGAYVLGKSQAAEQMEKVFSYFPILKERLRQRAGTLSGGEQQMLAIGRSLMSRPRLLLMDEPSTGLAPLLVQKIFQIVDSIKRKDRVTILLAEQNANMALSFADYGYVLSLGRISLKGPSSELIRHEEIRKAYLGN